MFEHLPSEIFQLIVENKTLSFRDLLNLSSTSSYNRKFILTNNKLWKKRYLQKWPKMGKKNFQIDNYYKEFFTIYEIRKKVIEMLTNLASNCYHKFLLSEKDFEPFIEQIEPMDKNWEYTLSYLQEILEDDSKIDTINTVPLTTPGNLTLKYYSLSSIRFIRQLQLSPVWMDFFCLPEEDQLLEIGASMLIQWFKPQLDISLEDVSNKLDTIAEEVKNFLKIIQPNHPLFQTPENVLKLWRDKNMYKNQFSTKDCSDILSAMINVICMEMDICRNGIDVYHIQDLFITDVLERKSGYPTTLCIIYEAVARRLGVDLIPVGVWPHVLLRFNDENGIKQQGFDWFNRGMEYPEVDRNRSLRATTKEVLEIMVQHIKRSLIEETPPRRRMALELKDLILPLDLNTTKKLANFYMFYEMDINKFKENISNRNYSDRSEAKDFLKLLTDYCEKYKDVKPVKKVVKRTPEVLYAVGMMVEPRNGAFTYLIYDWDEVCKKDEDWQNGQEVHRLKYGAKQPFYDALHVFVLSRGNYYCAQENLVPCNARRNLESNEEVGRYFSHFYKDHYVPNKVKDEEYPEDGEIRKMFHTDHWPFLYPNVN